MTAPSSSSAPQLEVSAPRLFTTATVLIHVMTGIAILGLPVLLSVLIVSSLRVGLAWIVLVPLLVLIGTSFFLPFGLGNAQITRLVHSLDPGDMREGFVVQMTVNPRLHSGLRAVLEDADDVGCLVLSDSALQFRGDSIRFCVEYARITRVEASNIGLRGLFVYGPLIEVTVEGLRGVESVRFAERSSWVVPTSRRITREIFRCLRTKVEKQAK